MLSLLSSVLFSEPGRLTILDGVLSHHYQVVPPCVHLPSGRCRCTMANENMVMSPSFFDEHDKGLLSRQAWERWVIRAASKALLVPRMHNPDFVLGVFPARNCRIRSGHISINGFNGFPIARICFALTMLTQTPLPSLDSQESYWLVLAPSACKSAWFRPWRSLTFRCPSPAWGFPSNQPKKGTCKKTVRMATFYLQIVKLTLRRTCEY